MSSLLVVDNYDSFTYNLVQLLEQLGARCRVLLNDAAEFERSRDVWLGGAQAIVISPGPGEPSAAGICPTLIAQEAGRVPLLGVCLGHQAIAAHFGGRVQRALRPLHGKTSAVQHDGQGLFEGLPQHFAVARYHSLAVARAGLPSCLHVSAESADGEILGLRHRHWPIESVQFHPESVLSDYGPELLSNWLKTL
jgi:para-aminobenzoate synthetase component 2